jgi:signal transduction histidine kinase
MTIRTRFTLLFAVISGVILSFFSIAIFYLSENYRQDDFRTRLQERAIGMLEQMIEARLIGKQPLIKRPEINISSTLIDEDIQIYDARGQMLYSDSNSTITTEEIIPQLQKKEVIYFSEGDKEGVGFTYKHRGQPYLLFAAAVDKHGMSYINNLRRILTVRLFILLLIIVLSGWLFSGYFIKPVSNIVKQADQITHSNLNYRLKAQNSNDEIGKLTATFNRMLERLETSFNIQKRFVSNASHELRNPLTAISGQIDVALLRDREITEYKKILESISIDIKDLRTLTNNLLELASSDLDTVYQDMEEVRIDEILWTSRDELLRQKPEYDIHISFKNITDNEQSLICKGKARLLETAFINLMDNACKFSHHKSVEVGVVINKKNTVINFKDQGIGMPESYLKHIFEPFYRGSNAQGIRGKGIGLSLVRGIVKLHGGRIFIHSVINEGTTVEIILPNLS